MNRRAFELSLTTQGPTYPPSELMDAAGNFVVIGKINRADQRGVVGSEWGEALVAASSPTPPFGENAAYHVIRELTPADDERVLYTLPLPLPCNNYPMTFAPEQGPEASRVRRESRPLHEAYIPDLRPEDGLRSMHAVTLAQWRKACGQLTVAVAADERSAAFELELQGLIPDSLYTIMALRERDLDPLGPTRPGPLGVPNVCLTDHRGAGFYRALMPNPFPEGAAASRTRIVNIVLLWMSTRMSYGGAIGLYGLGGDIHAQLKLRTPLEGFTTHA
jgi:hypothetical protein